MPVLHMTVSVGHSTTPDTEEVLKTYLTIEYLRSASALDRECVVPKNCNRTYLIVCYWVNK